MLASASDIATVGTGVVAVAALVVSIFSVRHSGASARASDRSANAAEVSARAAQDAADAAARTADAEEAVARIETARHERELAESAAADERAAWESRAANLALTTERSVEFESAEETIYSYELVIRNEGPQDAIDVAVNNFACNGRSQMDMPALAADPADAAIRGKLLADREHRIALTESHPEHNCWDVAECTLRWADGNGSHDERVRVSRAGW